jgi:hypothetical protein
MNKQFYISTDNKRELWIIAKGFVSPQLLQFDKPSRYHKRYRGLYRTSYNSPSAYNFQVNYIDVGKVKEVSRQEFDREADLLRVKLAMMGELVK